MEKSLNNTLQEILNTDGVHGVVVSDRQGLCLGAVGVGNDESSSTWSSLMTTARHLEPSLPLPTLVLESSRKQCVVQADQNIVMSIYKDRV